MSKEAKATEDRVMEPRPDGPAVESAASVAAPAEMAGLYRQLRGQDDAAMREAARLSYEAMKNRERQDEVNRLRERLDRDGRDLMTAMKDAARLNRGVEWDYDAEAGEFRRRGEG